MSKLVLHRHLDMQPNGQTVIWTKRQIKSHNLDSHTTPPSQFRQSHNMD